MYSLESMEVLGYLAEESWFEGNHAHEAWMRAEAVIVTCCMPMNSKLDSFFRLKPGI